MSDRQKIDTLIGEYGSWLFAARVAGDEPSVRASAVRTEISIALDALLPYPAPSRDESSVSRKRFNEAAGHWIPDEVASAMEQELFGSFTLRPVKRELANAIKRLVRDPNTHACAYCTLEVQMEAPPGRALYHDWVDGRAGGLHTCDLRTVRSRILAAGGTPELTIRAYVQGAFAMWTDGEAKKLCAGLDVMKLRDVDWVAIEDGLARVRAFVQECDTAPELSADEAQHRLALAVEHLGWALSVVQRASDSRREP